MTGGDITYELEGSVWDLFEIGNAPTTNNGVITWACNQPLPITPPTGPPVAIAGQLPSSITVVGQAPFSTTYGYPVMYVYGGTNGVPTLDATVTASSVSSDSKSATFPLPTSLGANSYGLVTENHISGGAYQDNGVSLFAIGSAQSQAGAPFGVAVAGISDEWADRDTCDRSQTGGTNYSSFPVLSLYSENEVLAGGYAISVGTGPNAVTAYAGPNVVQSSSDDCGSYRDIYSGANRAIVTNSGSNTVTLLDLVNYVSLGNVTVGNQPVAVVVSSNGDDAYVANYGDSTITRVALTSGNAATTIAVGGKPTSVALSANGTLWVGGAGFVTEVNTANMTVTATETSSKTIVALGYSDEVGQIVATATDSSGNVYADQLNPASVTAGGTYTPVHSALVSTLGTHLNTRTQAEVRSFTDTLASSPTLNINQPGGPPLVVYDSSFPSALV